MRKWLLPYSRNEFVEFLGVVTILLCLTGVAVSIVFAVDSLTALIEAIDRTR